VKIKLRNRLEVLMKDSGISTFEEMAERLTERQGWQISRSALSRKFRDDNVTLSLSMIEAICNELQCLPGDLFETNITDATGEQIDTLQSRKQKAKFLVWHLRTVHLQPKKTCQGSLAQECRIYMLEN
jgi:DNA-binding Xre family transcriptional regulator